MTNRKAEKFLAQNNEYLSYIIDYMASMEYDEIILRCSENNIVNYSDAYSKQYTTTIMTDVFDDTTVGYIEYLYQNGVLAIYKYNDVYMFNLWSSLDAGKGLLYSENDDYQNVAGIIDIASITSEWYYYYECMDIWLERQ